MMMMTIMMRMISKMTNMLCMIYVTIPMRAVAFCFFCLGIYTSKKLQIRIFRTDFRNIKILGHKISHNIQVSTDC